MPALISDTAPPSLGHRIALGPLEALYAALVRTRVHAYEQGWLRTFRASIPVISVGTLTAGGSGKTPIADEIADGGALSGEGPKGKVTAFEKITQLVQLKTR